ncbi:MAG: hypothetical protein ACE5FM_01695, partial [Methyloligellaceae bacterium]
MRSLLGRTRARELAAVCGFVLTITLAFVTGVFAQEPLLQPGEAYATRFSGTTVSGGQTVIDTSGTVG